jgi:hypothetical protein
MTKNYNSSKSNTSSVSDGEGGGGPDDLDISGAKTGPADPIEVDFGAKTGPSDPLEDIDIGSAKTGPTDPLENVDFGAKTGPTDALDGVEFGAKTGPSDPIEVDFGAKTGPSDALENVDFGAKTDVGGSEKSGVVDHNTTRSNRATSVDDGGGGGPDEAQGTDYHTTRSNNTKVDTGSGSAKSGVVDHNTTRSNRATSIGGDRGTIGMKSTLGLIKSGVNLVLIILVVAAGADVYKMYDDHVNINLEDHVTDANFSLTSDKESIVGDIGFDIPKMGYFDKSIDVLIHLKILESDPTTEDDFTFEYNLGSGEKIYDEFVLTNLDPVTKEKIDNGYPLDIEYTITITIIYLGVELGPTTSEVGTKVTTIQTA